MGSVTHNLFKLFRGGAVQNEASATPSASRIGRRSSGLNEFSKSISGQEGLCILDLGSTSATNISRLTGMGHKVCTEDLLEAAHDSQLLAPGPDGKKVIDVKRFLSESLAYQGQVFDAVLCWDVADYLPEPLVKPVVERLCALTKPGGILLAYFHTRDAGPDAPYYRYHMTGNDTLQLQPTQRHGSARFRLQRVFNNRHIENLFREFASLKFFLARDNVREVIVVR
ncbi:MAG: class I SAM-dependent methyltransferase [Acidobacteriia bacterium]|nr:class I SAM-dependent methyltransferase [Terriglobia bacterium]